MGAHPLPSNSLAQARQRMLEVDLAARGIKAPRVLAAMQRVPRERFVPQEFVSQAYGDQALPIDCEQTISQPYIVALMTEALQLSGNEHVLEIGTGSGYQAAVLAELAREVVTIERHAELSRVAASRLAELGYSNVRCLVGDGCLGWPPLAPYDRILITAANHEVPPNVWPQLREGGLLVAPLGGPHEQQLTALHKIAGLPHRVSLGGCRFVPLLGGVPESTTI